jgi:predicted transcriptional regulator
MSSRTTMTIEISQRVKDQLDALAEGVEQSSEHLAGDAVTAFVEEELALRHAVEKRISDAHLGNVISHEDAVSGMREMIAAARRERMARG